MKLIKTSLFVVLLAGCASQSRPIPGAENLVVESPRHAVGDEWRYVNPGRSSFFVRVTGFDEDKTITVSDGDFACMQCRYFRDANLTIVKVIDDATGANAHVTTGLKLLDFPLRVGKEWKQHINLTQASGAMAPYFNRFIVEAYEEMTVKAGTFKAFRIRWYQENRGPFQWSGSFSMWYSPEVKTFIKRVNHAGSWGPISGDWELASYSVGQPSPAPSTVRSATTTTTSPPTIEPAAQDETLTNDSIVLMSRAGFDENLIILKIRTSRARFDVTTDALIRLKASGVTDKILEAMIAKASTRP